jgi:cytochrome c biogenesis protein ResB
MIAMKEIWTRAGSTSVMVALCGLLTLDLGWAYFSLEKNLPIFAPMGDVGLGKWLMTYARHNLGECAWFLLMLVLLTLLAINTFLCTTERVTRLIRRKDWKLRWLGPHLMHYAVLVILLGYLLSYLLSSSYPGNALKPGASLDLPGGGGRITFLGAEPTVYRGERMEFFDGYILDPGIRLKLVSENETREAKLAFNNPIWFEGFDIHLIDFISRRENRGLKRIKLIIRRDPSSAVYLSGLGLFFVGLLLYGWDTFSRRNARGKHG